MAHASWAAGKNIGIVDEARLPARPSNVMTRAIEKNTKQSRVRMMPSNGKGCRPPTQEFKDKYEGIQFNVDWTSRRKERENED